MLPTARHLASSLPDHPHPGGQRYLATGSTPRFPIGSWNHVQVSLVSNAITVVVNGSPLVKFVDKQRPYLQGHLGLYTEDADAHYDNVFFTMTG